MNALQKQNLAGKTVLLVDDIPDNIELLKLALKSERFNIIEAYSGKEALEIVDKNNPDLIVLDVRMPEIDGFETCRRLKSNELTRNIPVIFITGKTQTEDIEEGFAAGCEEYITKPFKYVEVRNRIRTHLLLSLKNQQGYLSESKDPIPIAGLNVLIVEDNPTNIDVLRNTLEPFQLNISITTNGKIAVDIVPRIKPDLILLDVMMPEMNGFEVCRHLKENPATESIPIIFVTAKNQLEDIEKGFALGGADYVIKPFYHTEVQARVKSHLALRKLLSLKDTWLRQLEDAKLQLEDRVKEQTTSLQLAKEEAQQANKAKTDFIARMTHELRTPMNAILGFSYLMEKDLESSKDFSTQISSLSHIQKAGDHLLSLINDILDLSSIESGKTKITNEKVQPYRIIEEKVLPMVKLQSQERNIIITNQTAKHSELTVLCDPLRLTQILLNLMTNAIKYNKDGGSIILSTQETTNGVVRISVTDTGQGIPRKKLGTIFTPFYRLEENDPKVKGVGIGLTITKRLVELMGGKIFVDSTLGQGTCFTVELAHSNE